jgi:hypothetical protein
LQDEGGFSSPHQLHLQNLQVLQPAQVTELLEWMLAKLEMLSGQQQQQPSDAAGASSQQVSSSSSSGSSSSSNSRKNEVH